MKKQLITSALIFMSAKAFALPSPGEFIASQCGNAPYGNVGTVEVCFGSIMGAPLIADNNPNEELVYLRVGSSNYVGTLPRQSASSPTQPLHPDPTSSELQMSQIASAMTTPQPSAAKINVRVQHINEDILSAEIVLANGKVLSVTRFSAVGGAR